MEHVDEIIELYEKYGSHDYIGENQTQVEHMTRAAMLAEDHGENIDVILAAFLHDIGHLIEINCPESQMDNLGVINHENIGRDFLIKKGFNDCITNLVGNHVKAKRYLVAKNPEYLKYLSEASQSTLKFQKGFMNQQEIDTFENDPFFEKSIKLRFYDDQSKLVTLPIKSLDYYKNLMEKYFCQRLTPY
ncbi:putative HD phosphohydrolase [Cotonvirus japonicus]|uniref:HD phosphohydrolase n=1 Tax=Cotonvirus japonicus TaxID=2811091 RepID=A0ABM7NSQ5_9VIRU|nr:putative HD phosphohydrolase [Cotonvirus japonicus]BCS83117.1 putative HD phosphohydrolase [Cotonvirus japonicus]